MAKDCPLAVPGKVFAAVPGTPSQSTMSPHRFCMHDLRVKAL